MEPDAPSSFTIRMYNVGFGDCFLLSFHYPAGRDRHMLVDFGSAAPPKRGPADYMRRIALDIERQSRHKLDIVVATHRHGDHINGFATDGAGAGKIIASLKPDHVILPWTEDPDAQSGALPMRSHFLRSLEMMHGVAAAAVRLSADPQLQFLGANNLKNRSAVENLSAMGRRGKAWHVHAGMTLHDLLPGIKITVLGPPTLKQSDSIRTQRARDPHEFWQFCNFWSTKIREAAPAPGSRSPAP